MLKKFLNLGKTLSREEQKNVLGGQKFIDIDAEQDKCRIHVHNPDGTSYWTEYVSYEFASYNWNVTFMSGAYSTGYCCASC